jgi:Cys-tRNA(Pro)/Cys-tRNA(Cys) deacylase
VAGTETPATRAARAAGVDFVVRAFDHDPTVASWALEAAEALGLDPAGVFKTLVVDRDGTLTVCVVPADATLDLRSLGKRTTMADPTRAERVTGYVTGGISPLGQRRALPTILDDSAIVRPTIVVSAGRRGLEIELAPTDLVALTGAEVRRIRRAEG